MVTQTNNLTVKENPPMAATYVEIISVLIMNSVFMCLLLTLFYLYGDGQWRQGGCNMYAVGYNNKTCCGIGNIYPI